jgi:hypothetical protein
LFKPLGHNDVSTRKFKVYKNWNVDNTTTGSYNIFVQEGVSGSGVFNSQSDAKNPDGSYKRLVWSSIQHLYYPTRSLALREPLHPRAYLRNFIDIDKIDLITRSLDAGSNIAVLNIPVKVYGEEIKPGSVLIVSGSGVRVLDDGSYNLYVSQSGISPTSSVYIGNIFYQYGQMVITVPASTSLFTNFDLSFQSTHEIIEKEVFCEIGDSEFNYSVNPTSYSTDNIHYIAPLTSSLIKPYITQIGLYDDNNELIMIGKLPRPYKQDDVLDTTFVLRVDL